MKITIVSVVSSGFIWKRNRIESQAENKQSGKAWTMRREKKAVNK